jgi:hypothetical protein
MSKLGNSSFSLFEKRSSGIPSNEGAKPTPPPQETKKPAVKEVKSQAKDIGTKALKRGKTILKDVKIIKQKPDIASSGNLSTNKKKLQAMAHEDAGKQNSMGPNDVPFDDIDIVHRVQKRQPKVEIVEVDDKPPPLEKVPKVKKERKPRASKSTSKGKLMKNDAMDLTEN